jgi:hypothetical protein
MFKKLIVTVVILATASSVMARDITLTFADGSTHQYLNAPDSVSPEQIIQRAGRDFPTKTLTNVDGGNSQQGQGARPAEQESGITLGDVGTGLLYVGAFLLVGAAVYYGIDAIRHAGSAKAFPCTNPSDRARDGSLCGGRASSVRPGGR